MWQCFTHFKIWNLKFDKFKPNFKTLNDFRCKSNEYKSCSTHQDLQLLFWSSYYLTKFEPFKFKILKNDKLEPKFETQIDFNIKSDEYHFILLRNNQYKSCRSWWVIQLWYLSVFQLKSFGVPKSCLKLHFFEIQNLNCSNFSYVYIDKTNKINW